MATWGAFARAAPELAAFARSRLDARPAYLATVDGSGRPRVHPVTPIASDDALFVFMEPTSPKARDLETRGLYALHNGVPDGVGTGGEIWLRGTAGRDDEPAARIEASEAAQYDPADRYILFRLTVDEARAGGYGDVELPQPTRWREDRPHWVSA